MALADNIISYWKLDGNSNDSVTTNNGTDTNITYSAGNGKINQGAGFNGSSSKIVIADATSLKPTGAFSISAWVKSSDTGTVYIFQSKAQNPTNFAGFDLSLQAGGYIVGSIGNNTSASPDYVEEAGVGDGNWHHVVFVNPGDGSEYKLYIDGSVVVPDYKSATFANPSYQATNYVRMGCGNQTGTDANFITGAIDEVGLWSRALSSGEVTTLYNSGNGNQYPFSTAYTMATVVGAFVLTGVAVTLTWLTHIYTMAVTVGQFTLTGVNAGFTKALKLIATVGQFLLNGINVVMRNSAWGFQAKNNSINQTYQSKSNSNPTWTYQNK